MYSFFRFHASNYINLIPMCTSQYDESSLISIIRFAGIRTILVLMLHFAVSKPDEILSLCTGDQEAMSAMRASKSAVGMIAFLGDLFFDPLGRGIDVHTPISL